MLSEIQCAWGSEVPGPQWTRAPRMQLWFKGVPQLLEIGREPISHVTHPQRNPVSPTRSVAPSPLTHPPSREASHPGLFERTPLHCVPPELERGSQRCPAGPAVSCGGIFQRRCLVTREAVALYHFAIFHMGDWRWRTSTYSVRVSCPSACEIFPDQGSNSGHLHRQAES